MDTLARVRDSLIIFLLFAIHIAITPWNNLEAVVLPKFFLLISLGSVVLALSTPSFFDFARKGNSFLILASTMALLVSINVFINDYSLDERLFGIYGRNLGAITYFFLFLLIIPSFYFSDRKLGLFLNSFFTTSFLISVYFFLQFWGKDPANWQYVFGKIPNTTLGNPNFVGSYFGIVTVVAFGATVLKIHKSSYVRILNIIHSFLAGFIIYKSRAEQGVVIAAILGLLLVAGCYLFKKESKDRHFSPRRLLAYTFLSFFFVTIVVYLYQNQLISSLGARTDYWMNAFKQTMSSPFFGQGFDSFANRSMQFRSSRFPQYSDSPHNLILELSSSSGLPIAIGYISLQLMVLVKILRNWRILLDQKGSTIFLLILIWVGFHLQSLINPGTLPFLSIGFVLTGILFSQFNFSTSPENAVNVAGKKNQVKVTLRPSTNEKLLTIFNMCVFIPASTFIAFAPLGKDSAFRNGIEKGDGEKIIEVVNRWPYNSGLSLQAAHILKDNEFKELAAGVLNKSLHRNRDDYFVWKLLLDISSESSNRPEILRNLNRLNPLNRQDFEVQP